jgi:hypothetical protein
MIQEAMAASAELPSPNGEQTFLDPGPSRPLTLRRRSGATPIRVQPSAPLT